MLRVAIGWFCLGALLLTGCASMGPPTIARDRFDYVTSISDSWKRQMLLNLLKVRYSDAPVFMDVSSVINSYTLEGDISLGGEVAPVGRGDTLASLGVTGRYADKPTITYQPLAGEKFARSLMAPIPVTGILLLVQGGYPADVVFRICVNTINGLENAYGGSGNPRAGNPKFRELMTALREAQAAGGSGMRIKQTKDTPSVVMFFHPTTDNAIVVPDRKIRELLGLDASAREFNVVYGSHPENDQEIAILTRSILQVLIDIASYIDVPAADLTEGRVYSLQRTPEEERMFPKLLNVRNGPSAPDDAYVSIRYRNQWFWIDDRDPQSKSMFATLLLLFSLTETGQSQAAPLVTIPTR
jgi:hypothetical protein